MAQNRSEYSPTPDKDEERDVMNTEPLSCQWEEGVNDSEEEDCYNCASLLKVFGNHVVMERIMSYLDYTSLKLISETCHLLLRVVRSNRDFLDRSRLRIVRVDEGEDGVNPMSLQPGNFPWKNLAVDVNSWASEERKAILALLPHVESLEITNNSNQKDATLYELVRFLGAADNMRELTIDAEVLSVVGRKDCIPLISTLEKTKSVLEKLRTLRIRFRMGMYFSTHSFLPVFNELAKIPIVLTSFAFEGICFVTGLEPTTEVASSIVTILDHNKTSLRSLSLENFIRDGEAETDPVIGGLVFPALQELSLRAQGSELKRVASFLGKQPPLTSLSLTFGGSPVVASRPLLAPLLAHGPTLQKFHLVWKLDETPRVAVVNLDGDDQDHQYVQAPDPWAAPAPAPPPPVPWDFSFLKDFVSIRELKVHRLAQSRSRYTIHVFQAAPDPESSPGPLLAAIPDGVKSINLAGWVSGVWNNQEPQLTMESLGRFRNLTVLNLVQTISVLDDEILAFICMEMTQLREFGFSHCNGVTDVGLTGKKEGESIGPGIKALTGLLKLRILCCPTVTPEGYLASISFQNLKYLTLIVDSGIKKSFYLEIAAQNQNLEVLEIHSEFDEDNMERIELKAALREELKSQSHCFRLLKLKFPPSAFLNNLGSDEEGEWDSDEFSSVSGDGFGHFFGVDDLAFDSDDLDYGQDDDEVDYNGYSDDGEED